MPPSAPAPKTTAAGVSRAPGVVSAFLVSGSPLPLLCPTVAPWRPLAEGYRQAQRALAASRPDVLLVYSTQWLAVLDQLWQARARLSGVHVDENWHEFGELAFDIRADVELAQACVAACKERGIRAKGVDYDGFPIDTGSIVMQRFLNPDGALPLVIAANNIYHDAARTAELARLAVDCAVAQHKRVALIGVGGLSGTLLREDIDPAQDRIAAPGDDEQNRRLLALLDRDGRALNDSLAEFAKTARLDAGGKHIAWLLGGLGRRLNGATVHAYGPAYGSGQAVVELTLNGGDA